MERRGSIYVFVLGASTLAVAAGMTAVLLHKERLSRVNLTVESQKARADAQSGLEFALAVLSADPAGTTWRSSSTLAFANKRYFGADASDITISLADPTDSDLTDSNLDPVVVSVSAVSGQCEQNYEMTLAPAQTPLSCLDFAVTVGGALSKVGTGNIYTSGAVSVGKAWEVDSDAKPSVIDALNTVALAMPVRTSPVTVFRPLAGGKTTTTTMSAQSLTVGDGSTTAGGGTNSRSGAAYDPETMEAMVPNTSDTIKYYRSIGTTINFSSLSSGAIRDCVLSASKNPFGSTNATGTYIIDCGGSDITLRNCRINATLVLLNAGSGSLIRDNVNIEAPSATQPALIVQGSMTLSTLSTDLVESTAGVNFNPAGSPYDGSADSDTADQYPSWIKGLVFVSGNVSVTNGMNPTFRGALVVGGNLSIQTGAELRVQYAKPAQVIPGFAKTTGMSLTPGSLQRVVK